MEISKAKESHKIYNNLKDSSNVINKYIQYMLIFMLISLNGSFLFEINKNIFSYIIIFMYIILMLKYRKFKIILPISIILVLLNVIIFIRGINNGGIGLESWSLWSAQILIVFMAYMYNQKMFFERYVKMITTLALISIIFWIISIINPDFLINILQPQDAESYKGIFYGKTLFVYRTSIMDIGVRNNGIFSEPGRYQTILISCMYILLYRKDKLKLYDNKKIMMSIIIITITLGTTTSTTGFINLLILFIFYFFNNINENIIEQKKIKKKIIILILIVISFLSIDVAVNKDQSLYNKVIVSKLIESVDDASSGGARISVIDIYIDIIKNNPLGVGFDNITYSMSVSDNSSNLAGAGMLSFLAAVGIIPFLLFLFLISYPFWRYGYGIAEHLMFIMIYINTGFSQTYIFYPSLIVIPITLYLENKKIKGGYCE